MKELIIAILLAGITQIAKHYNINQKYVVLVLAIVGGAGYALYTHFVPEATQENIAVMSGTILGYATAIYNVITIFMNRETLKS